MSIKTLIADINAAVEWWTDYQEDDRAGEELLPFDMVTDGYTYNKNDIDRYISEILEAEGINVEKIDFDYLIDTLLHFHLSYSTGHIFSSPVKDSVTVLSVPIQEHCTQFDIDASKHGRITEGRLKAAKKELEACVSGYQVYDDGIIQSIELAWPTDAVWVVYITNDAILEAYDQIKDVE